MKFFVKGWYEDYNKAEEVMRKYHNYYRTIENQLPDSIKNVLKGRHDTHIVNTFFENNNYIMNLDEHEWGKPSIIFSNAIIKKTANIENEYWLYDEVYLQLDKIELHISLSKSDIVIVCDDAYISVEDKDYFKKSYAKEDFNIDLGNNKEDIANTVINKEKICGFIMLQPWEKLIYSFIQIYLHINYYQYNNIEDKIEKHYYNFSEEEKQNKYKILLLEFEESLRNSISILQKYKTIIDDKELDSVIKRFLETLDSDVTLKEKNQLYLNLCKQSPKNPNKIYRRILECINGNLIE